MIVSMCVCVVCDLVVMVMMTGMSWLGGLAATSMTGAYLPRAHPPEKHTMVIINTDGFVELKSALAANGINESALGRARLMWYWMS